jgi:hypothetical protein
MTSIHCPSCGKEATAEQQFCRQCGMSLGSVSKLVAAHSGVETIEKRSNVERDLAEKRIVRKMFNWMITGIIILGIGILMLVLTKSFNPGEWFKLCASFLLLAGTGIAVAGFFRAIKEGLDLQSKAAPNPLPKAEPTKYLPEERTAVPMPSITERTTQLIAPNDKSESDN